MTKELKQLKNDFKNKNIKNVYLIYGDDTFLIQTTEKVLQEELISKNNQIDTFEPPIDIDELLLAALAAPLFGNKRIIKVKNSGFFSAGDKKSSEKIATFLSSLPSYTTLLFIEDKADKRLQIYKETKKVGTIIECNALSETETMVWAKDLFASYGIELSNQLLIYFIRYVGSSMENMYHEAMKLIDYAQNEPITKESIQKVCIQSFESHIFDLTDALGEKNIQKALHIYNQLLQFSESPIGILSMLARQYKIMLQCKYLSDKKTPVTQMATTLKLPKFVINKYLEQSRYFSNNEEILSMYKSCLDVDLAIKTGKMNDKLAVELLIIQYADN